MRPSECETYKSSVLGQDPVLGRSLGSGAKFQRNKGLTTVQSSSNLWVVQLRSGVQGLVIGLRLEITAEQGGLRYSLCYKLRGYSPKRPNRNLRGQYFIQDNLLPTSPLVRHRILSQESSGHWGVRARTEMVRLMFSLSVDKTQNLCPRERGCGANTEGKFVSPW